MLSHPQQPPESGSPGWPQPHPCFRSEVGASAAPARQAPQRQENLRTGFLLWPGALSSCHSMASSPAAQGPASGSPSSPPVPWDPVAFDLCLLPGPHPSPRPRHGVLLCLPARPGPLTAVGTEQALSTGMDGGMDGRVDGWVDGWMDAWVDGLMSGWMMD